MSSGAYAALSGLRTRMEQLDRLASDIANAGTSGYKAERSSDEVAERPFAAALKSAIDVMPGEARLDFSSGPLTSTGRDLDLAIEGKGFFVIDGENGPRFTRNGHFTRAADGGLVTEDGRAVQAEDGRPLRLPGGAVGVNEQGYITVNGAPVSRPRIVDFDDYATLAREDHARFRGAAAPKPVADAVVRGGILEQSNVSVMDHIAELTTLSRGFEALQRGVSVLLNDIDGKAISEFGRR